MLSTTKLYLSTAILSTFALSAMAQQSVVPTAMLDDTFLVKTQNERPNQEPSIFRPIQEKNTQQRLNELKKRFGHSPNIIVILLDDVGWGDLGVYGGGVATGAATPNMDRMAKEGLQLMNAYSQPSCTPTRATILTGQLPIRTGLLRPMLPGEGSHERGIDPSTTLPQKLKNAGYITQAIGKWHLGTAKEAQPQNVGFDDYYGILTSSDDYTAWRESWRNPELMLDPVRKAWAAEAETMAIVQASKGQEAKQVFPINNDSIRLVDEKLTNKAINFITEMKGSKKPFFLYMGARCCHNDNYPHPDFAGKSLAKYPYKDALVEIDYRVGQIRTALEKSGQLENTLIILTSDNGPFTEAFPDTGFTPFRGAKATSYEGGVRVPGIAFWPGVIKPGRVSEGLFDLTDIYATSLGLAGASEQMPNDRYMDTIDQSSFLLADNGKSRRRIQYYWANDNFMGIRIAEYKLLVKEQSFNLSDTWPQMSPFQGTAQPLLYGGKIFNLLIDAKEENAMAPLKQPQIPVLKEAVMRHLETMKKYKTPVPFR
ncbi:arylsulfatase [Acinetobacter guillouiae]|jgi:arylsulfatase A-like enzyme|uniref:arylsulfatase n=1 Tax=Acinetobacter guillouiae TaxID=106649 RepID=UPI003AF4F354